MFKKRNTVDVDRSMLITAGIDLGHKHSICLQKVNDIWCVCVHEHDYEDGMHYSEFSDKSLVSAIPIKRLVELCLEKQMWWRYSK